MKKLLLTAFIFAAAASFAGTGGYGVDKGQTRVGVYGGVSVPQDWKEDDSSSRYRATVPPGETGFIAGAEMLNSITPIFALGLDMGYANYGKKEFSDIANITTSVLSIHALGRLYLAPEKRARIYVPFGAGVSHLSFTTETLNPLLFEGVTRSQTGFSCFAGLGFEFDLSRAWTAGVEGRYFYMPLDKDNFGDNSKFSSLNVLLKIGARF